MSKEKINNIEDRIIFDSLGLLDKDERERLKSVVKHVPEKDKKIVSEFNNLVSLFPKVLDISFKEISSSTSVKKKLFDKINEKKSSAEKLNKKGFDFIYAESNDWIQHPIEGIKIKQLAVNEEKGYVMLLMKVAAGTKYPSHHHSGAEECYIIEGDLYAEGKILGPGDFHHADGQSDHGQLHTKHGCMLLLVVDPADYK